MNFHYRQQDKGCLSLCVCEKFKNDFYFELKNKINSQIYFFVKNNIETIDLQQSNISESCYVQIFFKSHKYPANIRISSHYGNDENTIIIENTNDIKNTFHFNKTKLYIIEKEVKEFEKELRSKKRF